MFNSQNDVKGARWPSHFHLIAVYTAKLGFKPRPSWLQTQALPHLPQEGRYQEEFSFIHQRQQYNKQRESQITQDNVRMRLSGIVFLPACSRRRAQQLIKICPGFLVWTGH